MRRLAWTLIPLLTACNTTHQRTVASTMPRADDPAARVESGLLPAVLVKGEPHRWTLAEHMREYRIPAVSIAVFNNYRVEWARAYGIADVATDAPATIDTLFQAGSISKPVAAMAALMAVAHGAFAIDAPINNALTTWKLPDNELTRTAPVTLRRLLSHTAGTTVHGFPGYVAGAPLPTLPQVLDGQPPANTPPVRVDLAPGTKFRYSGGGITIMQQALVDRLGKPFPAILHDSVLAPIGMSHSTYEQPLPAATVGSAAAGHDPEGKVIEGKRNVYPEMAAAGLWTTPTDLARFFIELQLARAGRSKHVSREIATEMTTPVAEVFPGYGVGLGTFISKTEHTFGHNGADEGFESLAVASLDRGYGVVVMANSNNGNRIFDEIVRAVAAEYGWDNQPPTIARAAIGPDRLARWKGRFATGTLEPFTVSSGANGLEMRRPFGESSELVPVADNEFVETSHDIRLRMEEGGREITLTFPHGETRKVSRLADDVRIPILELDDGHYDEALVDYQKLQRATPNSPALDEQFLNWIGLEQLWRNRYDKAIALLRVNVALYPDSMNTYDSLGEAYVRAGEHAKAIATFEAGLAAMPRDKNSPTRFKEQLEHNAKKRLAELRSH
jgi:CubicO group peptidase (beta-lactamase class C family)